MGSQTPEEALVAVFGMGSGGVGVCGWWREMLLAGLEQTSSTQPAAAAATDRQTDYAHASLKSSSAQLPLSRHSRSADLPHTRVCNRVRRQELARLSALPKKSAACAAEGRLEPQLDIVPVAFTTMAANPKDKSPKVEKASKKDKSDKKSKKEKKSSGEKQDKVANATVSLLADKKAVNPALSSLFSAQVFIESSVHIDHALTTPAYTTYSPRNRSRARGRGRGR